MTDDSILIVKEAGKGWTVVIGNRYADGLADDECLGVIASMIYAGKSPCYVRSPREHADILKAQAVSSSRTDPLYVDKADPF